MAVISSDFRWRSNALGFMTDCRLLIPDAREVPPPWNLLLLLHGRSDDCTAWTRFSAIERHLEGYPLVVAMPNGYVSYYRDPIGRSGVETALMMELIPLLETTLPIRSDRFAQGIAGLSMGGYGALYLAAKYPEQFCAVSALSPAVLESRRGGEADRNVAWQDIFGSPIDEDTTLLNLLSQLDANTSPEFQVIVGDRDFLLEEAKSLDQWLKRYNLRHVYHERQGAHDWNFWERQIPDMLRFQLTEMKKWEKRGED
ncbi:MAG: alpha/beta hydrolase family protein [Candidatus Sumerlaeia bacterium]|nr:alpha/beta hydrolase family protein [Candidatus Sumerlaeia bacterium]